MDPIRTGGARSRIKSSTNQCLDKDLRCLSSKSNRPVPDEDIYKNSTGVFTTSGKIALEKKKEEIDKDQMKVFGILMKHIEPNSRAWAILGDLVKDSDPVAVFKKLKEADL